MKRLSNAPLHLLTAWLLALLCSVHPGSVTAGQPIGSELSRALRFFSEYDSPPNAPSGYKDISITYVVITGAKTVSRTQVLHDTWGRSVSPPHRLLFVADEKMGPNADKYSYMAHKASKSMIPLQYSSGAMTWGGVGVKSLSDYRRSQLKWLDAILHLGRELQSNQGGSTDWFVFLDDDTFILPGALAALLSEYNPSTSLLLGKGGRDCHKLCGGAGFALSRALLLQLYQCKDALVDAFFTGYAISSGTDDPNKTKYHSDVVLSNFILGNRDKTGLFVRRQEFKNFSPVVASRWVEKQFGSNATTSTVSFHRLGGASEYYQAYEFFKKLKDRRNSTFGDPSRTHR